MHVTFVEIVGSSPAASVSPFLLVSLTVTHKRSEAIPRLSEVRVEAGSLRISLTCRAGCVGALIDHVMQMLLMQRGKTTLHSLEA